MRRVLPTECCYGGTEAVTCLVWRRALRGNFYAGQKMLGKEGAQTGSEGSQSRLSSEWADKRDWQGPDVTADEATNGSETGRWHT